MATKPWWERLRTAQKEVRVPGSEVRFGRTLESLVTRIRRHAHPYVLDLGYTVGVNIDYFVRMGCKVHVDDYIAGLVSRPATPPPTPSGDRKKPGRSEEKIAPRNTPAIEQQSARFHAVLCWDLFDYVQAEEAWAVAQEIRRVVAESAYVFALFGPSRPGESRAPLRFRIQDDAAQVQAEEVSGPRVRPLHLGNREILRLFPDFDIAQTVLLKNGVREMLLQKRNSPSALAAPTPS